MTADPSTGSGSALNAVEWPDRRSRVVVPILAALTGAAAWLSAGTVAYTGGAGRVAALPPVSFLIAAMVVAVVAAQLARLRGHGAWPLAISALIVLPFLPGSIPAAFMLWQGPLEAIVWALVIAGLIGARGVSLPISFSDPQRAPWIAGAMVATLSLIAFYNVRAVVPGGDEPHYLVATQSLIADGDLKVENNYTAGNYLVYFAGRLQPHFLQRSTSGEIYSIHSPGLSVIVLPAFAIAGYLGAVVTVIAISALTAAFTWTVAWRLTNHGDAAWAGLVAVFATAPFLFHSFTIYPDGVGALAVIFALWLIVRLFDGGVPKQRTLIAAGAALALLPWLHTRFAILAAILGAVVIAQLATGRIRPTRIAAFLAIPAVAAAAWFSYFWIIWGTPSPLAPYGRDTESSATYIMRGLTGLLFDQQHGVVSTAPVYAVAVVGLWSLVRRRSALAIALVITVVTYVIAVSTYAMWWGGTSAPARFVAAILPIGAVLIACAWGSYPRVRTGIFVLLIVSAALVMPRLLEEGGSFVFNTRNAFDPTLEWLSPNVDVSLAVPSIHRDGPHVALVDTLPWLIAIALVIGDSYMAGRMAISRGAAWAAVVFSGAVMTMAAATMVWMVHGSAGATPERSMLAAVANNRAWHSGFVDVSRMQAISREAFLSHLAISSTADDDAALLRLRRVPAGEYEIAGEGGAEIAAIVNRNDPVLETGTLPFRLRLPVDVASLGVRAAARLEQPPSLTFTPVQVTPAVNADGRAALRAARYGRARVFFFDERAYLEPKGFWTRAEGRATVVIDADDDARRRGLPIAFTAGAVATTIGISAGEWSDSYSMTPGQRREITLPPLTGMPAWVVDIHSGPGFRPFEREAGSVDVRALAAWFEIP